MSRISFVSDLHLFSQRSHAEKHDDLLHDAAEKSDVFVLGGDIFDFKWSTLPTLDESISAAGCWLVDFATAHSNCQFHLLLGNHDHDLQFMGELQRVRREASNFAWDPYLLRMGEAVFLHGDVADHGGHEALENSRSRNPKHKRKGTTANLMYDMVMHSRLHVVVPMIVYPRRRVASRILSYLEQIGHGREDGTKHVYFGHTHRAMENYEHGGIYFHNGGAPMKGLDFKILGLEMGADLAAREEPLIDADER